MKLNLCLHGHKTRLATQNWILSWFLVSATSLEGPLGPFKPDFHMNTILKLASYNKKNTQLFCYKDRQSDAV